MRENVADSHCSLGFSPAFFFVPQRKVFKTKKPP